MNVKLLDASRGYWQKDYATDWKIVTDTVVTACTFLVIPEDLDLRQPAFRIGAPSAPQRASLEKHDRLDSRSVIDIVFLYVKDHIRFCTICLIHKSYVSFRNDVLYLRHEVLPIHWPACLFQYIEE